MTDNKNKWWEGLPHSERDKLAQAYLTITQLAPSWRDVAEETNAKEGPAEPYARGIASGLGIAAKALDKALADMDAVMPKCPHDKPLLAMCVNCVVWS